MAPGLFVNAEIEGRTIPDILFTPRAALRGEDRIFIGLPDEGKLSIRTVDLVYSDENGAYIRSGVSEGEYAITSPIQAPFEGMNITVMQRMPDGTVKTFQPKEAGKDKEEFEETAMRLTTAGEGATE